MFGFISGGVYSFRFKPRWAADMPQNMRKGAAGLSNSPLVNYTKISPNKNSPRNHAIDTITIHCVVGQCLVETLGNIFTPISKGASSNYGIGPDGRIGMYVEEKDRSWCSSSEENDNRAVTIEVASDTTEPYAVTEAAYNALLDLVTDICKRNGIKRLKWSTDKNERVNHLNGCNMTAHRDYANKSCVPVDTEVLTRSGWKRLKDIAIGEKIACADIDNLRISFEEVYDMVEPHYHDTYTNNGFTATKDHRVVHCTQKNKTHFKISPYSECLRSSGVYLPMAGHSDFAGLPIEDEMLRFLIAVQADGHYMYEKVADGLRHYYGVEFHFKKERKIERIIWILSALGLPYRRTAQKNGTTKIRIYNYNGINIVNDICEKFLSGKDFTWEWINLNPEQAKIFLDEIQEWDGCRQVKLYSSKSKININVVSAIAALNGVGSNIYNENTVVFRDQPFITLGETVRNNQRKRTAETFVSCVSVKTGIFLCRQHGKTFITGNCPGTYLYEREGAIAEEVNKRLRAAAGTVIYRVRKSWADAASQKAAYRNLDSAKKCADENAGYYVFDEDGNIVYPIDSEAQETRALKAQVEALKSQIENLQSESAKLHEAVDEYELMRTRILNLIEEMKGAVD